MIYKDKINVKFHLIRWRYYEEQRYQMEGTERENAVMFFNGLRQLSLEDQKLLAEKYYHSNEKANYDPKTKLHKTNVPIKDGVLCVKHNLSKEKYQHEMRLIYYRLEKEMLEVCQLMYDKLKEFKLMLGKGVYFKGYLNSAENSAQDFLLSQSVTKGKTFTVGTNNSEYHNLMSLGFKKVPIK